MKNLNTKSSPQLNLFDNQLKIKYQKLDTLQEESTPGTIKLNIVQTNFSASRFSFPKITNTDRSNKNNYTYGSNSHKNMISSRFEKQKQLQSLLQQSSNAKEEKSYMFEKLKKRTLRSKVLNLLDNVMYNTCGKLVAYSKRNEELSDLKKKIQVTDYREFVQTSHDMSQILLEQPDLKSRRKPHLKSLNFSKYDQNEFVYSKPQTSFQQELDQTLISKKQQTFQGVNLDQYEEAQNAIFQLSKHLTADEILEIGEDPNYFIVKEDHRRNKELLDPQNWTEIGMELKNQKKKQLNKNQKNKLQLQQQQNNQSSIIKNKDQISHQNNNSQEENDEQQQQQQQQENVNISQISNINTNQNQMDSMYIQDSIIGGNNNNSNQMQTQQQTSFSVDFSNKNLYQQKTLTAKEYNTLQEEKKRKYNESLEYANMRKLMLQENEYNNLMNNHQNRIERWMHGQQREEKNYFDKKYNIVEKMKYKEQKAQMVLEGNQNRQKELKQMKQNQEQELYQDLQKNKQEVSEDDEIFIMQENLRRMCLNDKVQRLKKEQHAQKLQKLEELRKFQPKVELNLFQKQLEHKQKLDEAHQNILNNNKINKRYHNEEEKQTIQSSIMKNNDSPIKQKKDKIKQKVQIQDFNQQK